MIISVDIPVELNEQLKKYQWQVRQARKEAVRTAIEQYIAQDLVHADWDQHEAPAR